MDNGIGGDTLLHRLVVGQLLVSSYTLPFTFRANPETRKLLLRSITFLFFAATFVGSSPMKKLLALRLRFGSSQDCSQDLIVQIITIGGDDGSSGILINHCTSSSTSFCIPYHHPRSVLQVQVLPAVPGVTTDTSTTCFSFSR
jgi:hypothetical protein